MVNYSNNSKLRQSTYIKRSASDKAASNTVVELALSLLICVVVFSYGIYYVNLNNCYGNLGKQVKEAEKKIETTRREISNAQASLEHYTGREYIAPKANKLGLRFRAAAQPAYQSERTASKGIADKNNDFDRRFYLGIN